MYNVGYVEKIFNIVGSIDEQPSSSKYLTIDLAGPKPFLNINESPVSFFYTSVEDKVPDPFGSALFVRIRIRILTKKTDP